MQSRFLPSSIMRTASGEDSNNQYACINTEITPITFSTTGATGASFSGLPTGVSGDWLSGTITISGIPTVLGSFDYTVSLTGGCGDIKTTGTITVNPDNTITLTSASGTISQTLCISTTITPVNYSTTGATGATASGLPAGISCVWSANKVTLNGKPTESGTFNYTITLTGGCGNIDTEGTIIVKPNNTISITSAEGTDEQSVCNNSSISQITYSTTGATDLTVTGLPSNFDYIWNDEILTINGLAEEAGTYDYLITLTGGCGNISETGSITVNPNSTINLISSAGSDDQSVCVNSQITNIRYSTTVATSANFAGLPPGVTATWVSDVATISGIPTSSNTYNYTVTPTGGCGDTSATGSVIVKPRPAITSVREGFHCGPGEVSLEATSGSGIIYWYSYKTGGSILGSGTSFTTPVLSNSKDYYVDATADGCTTEERSKVTAIVFPVNIPSIVLKWDDVLICSNVDTLYTDYQWIRDDNDVPNATKQYYVTTKIPGSYKVRVIDINGCETTSDEITLSGTKSLTLYPNPAKGSFSIMLKEEIIGKVNIKIINDIGVKVKEINTEKNYQEFIYDIPVDDMNNGIYFIHLVINDISMYVGRIIVSK